MCALLATRLRTTQSMILIADTFFFFFFNDTATTEIYTLSLHDALPISVTRTRRYVHPRCPNVFPGPSQLADPHCSLVLHSPASGRRFRRLLAPAAPASGAAGASS